MIAELTQSITSPKKPLTAMTIDTLLIVAGVVNGDTAKFRRAIMKAFAANVLIFNSSGNTNSNLDEHPHYPTKYQEVIGVAGTNQKDLKVDDSNYGSIVSVSAPGFNIYTTQPEGEYIFDGGTSMASPFVAGLAALILSVDKNLTNIRVREIIENSADNIDNLNQPFSGKLGKGRINAKAAILHLIQV